jgi:hypothetical protein
MLVGAILNSNEDFSARFAAQRAHYHRLEASKFTFYLSISSLESLSVSVVHYLSDLIMVVGVAEDPDSPGQTRALKAGQCTTSISDGR